MPLFRDARENVRLERWPSDAEIVLPAPSGLELLVLEGGFSEGRGIRAAIVAPAPGCRDAAGESRHERLPGLGQDRASLAPANRAAGRLNPIAVTAKPAVLRPEGPRYDQTDRLRPDV